MADKSQQRRCPECNSLIPHDAPGGMCPRCLLEHAGVSGFDEPERQARLSVLCRVVLSLRLGITDSASLGTVLLDIAASEERVDFSKILANSDDVEHVENLFSILLEQSSENIDWIYSFLGGPAVLRDVLGEDSDAYAVLDLHVPDRGAYSPFEEPVSIDEKPGRYTFKSEYSRGGMGRILLVHDDLLSRDVALKELLPDTESRTATPADSPMRQAGASMARFVREARITGQLEHPSIVPVYELGRRASGATYYTMKFVRGKTLRKAFEECNSLEERLNLLPHFLDLCLGLAYAHSRRIVHRDIKPENVLIGEFGETVIIDWGLAKVLGSVSDDEEDMNASLSAFHELPSDSPAETKTGSVLGTPNYMSPEQAAGKISSIDERSDVFSLGIVLYELITGHVPFESDTAKEVIRSIIESAPPSPDSFDRRAPRELVQVCFKALAKRAGDRYASAKDLSDDVRKFMSGSLVTAFNYSIWDRVRHIYSAHRAVCNVIAASMLIVIAGTAVAFAAISDARDREREERLLAEERGYVSGIRLAAALIEEGQLLEADAALEELPSRFQKWERGFLKNAANPHRWRIPDARRGALSPAGDVALAGGGGAPLQVWSIAAESVLHSIDGDMSQLNHLQFSESGNYVLGTFDDGQLVVWRTVDWSEMGRRAHPGFRIVAVAFTSDEAGIVVATTEHNVLRYSLDLAAVDDRWELSGLVENSTGEELVRRVDVHPGGSRYVAWIRDGAGGEDRVVLSPEIAGGETRQWSGQRARFTQQGDAIMFVQGSSIRVVPLDAELAAYEIICSSGRITDYAVHTDGRTYVMGTESGYVEVGAVGTATPTHLFRHGAPVLDLEYSEASGIVVATSWAGEMSSFSVSDGDVLYSRNLHSGKTGTISMDRAGRLAMSRSADGITIWDAGGLTGYRKAFLSQAAIRKLDAPGTGLLAVNDGGNRARVVDELSLAEVQSWHTPRVALWGDVAVSSDGETMAWNLDGNSVAVAAINSNTIAAFLDESVGPIYDLEFSPKSDLLAAACWDGNLYLWDLTAPGAPPLRFEHDAEAFSCTFSDDGLLIAVGTSDNAVWVWNVGDTSEPIHKLVGDASGGRVQHVSFSEEGVQLVTSTVQGDVRTWDLGAEGSTARNLTASKSWYGAKFTPESIEARILTYDDVGAFSVWSVESGHRLYSIGIAHQNLAGIELADDRTYLADYNGSGIYRLDTPGLDSRASAGYQDFHRAYWKSADENQTPDRAVSRHAIVSRADVEAILSKSEESESRFFRLIGVKKTGTLAKVNNRDDWRGELRAVLDSEAESFRVEIGNPAQQVDVWLRESREETLDIVLSREAAIEFFQTQREFLQTYKTEVRDYQKYYWSEAESRGYIGPRGFLIANDDSPEMWRMLQDVGLAMDDRIVSLSSGSGDRAEPGPADYFLFLDSAIEALESGEPWMCQITVRRGGFQTLNISYTVL